MTAPILFISFHTKPCSPFASSDALALTLGRWTCQHGWQAYLEVQRVASLQMMRTTQLDGRHLVIFCHSEYSLTEPCAWYSVDTLACSVPQARDAGRMQICALLNTQMGHTPKNCFQFKILANTPYVNVTAWQQLSDFLLDFNYAYPA